MMDLQNGTVCCMCGDVGFPDKLFRCSKCLRRFQHSYCSNYYGEAAIEVCDWCQSEERNSSTHGNLSSSSRNITKTVHANIEVLRPTAYGGGDRIKQRGREEGGAATPDKAAGKSPSPRQTTRRYKLLKDVMC